MFEQFCWILCFLKHKIHLQSLNIIWLLNVDHFHDLWILERRGWVIKYIIKYVTVKQKFNEAFYNIRPALHVYLFKFDVSEMQLFINLLFSKMIFSRFPGWVPRHLDQGQECALILAKQMQTDVGDDPVSQQHSPVFMTLSDSVYYYVMTLHNLDPTHYHSFTTQYWQPSNPYLLFRKFS